MMIDIRKELGITDPQYIKKKGPDKMAALSRLATTENHFEKWLEDVNKTYTADMPTELIQLYEDAADIMFQIMAYERDLILTHDVKN